MVKTRSGINNGVEPLESILKKPRVSADKTRRNVSIKSTTTVWEVMETDLPTPIKSVWRDDESDGHDSFCLVYTLIYMLLMEWVNLGMLVQGLDNTTGNIWVIQYEWKPPHCVKCKSFGHSPTTCPNHVKEAALKALSVVANKPSPMEDREEGFVEVKNQKKKGKASLKSNFQYRLVSKPGKDMDDASKLGANGPKEGSFS
ncbi:hypothetical protein Tco_0217204 [Tanacetum coccineum]